VPHVVITGASGLLGANLTLAARLEGWTVTAVCNRHPIQVDGVDVACLDLSIEGAAETFLLEKRPEVVIHCAAATNIDACEHDPELAYHVNRDMAAAVARGSSAIDAHLVHISTDAVFDGAEGGYVETDEPGPLNVYAESKLAGEHAVAKACPAAAVVRTNLFGWNAQDKFSLAEWFLHHFKQGRPFNGFTDVWFSPILVNHLARILLTMGERRLGGIYHVAGHDCMTKYDFGCRLAETFGLDAGILQPVSVDDVGLKANRSKKLCLNVERIEAALDEPMPLVREGIDSMLALQQDGYRDRLKRMLGDKPG